MHAGEGRHGRSRPFPSLTWRALIGAFMGAYLGVLELRVYNSDLAAILAVTAADPKFTSVAGFDTMLWTSVARFQKAVFCAPERCAVGMVWGLIEHQGVPNGSIALALGAGALLGALIALFARTSKNAVNAKFNF